MRALIFLTGLLLLVTGPASATPAVKDVRLGVHPDMTRFVVEMDEAPRYRVFTLPDPYRVVIDLPEVTWPGDEERRAADGLVTALRFGLFTPGTSRIVLDASAPLEVRELFILSPRDGYGYRLVIDLAEVERAHFLRDVDSRVYESDAPLPVTRISMPSMPQPQGDLRPTVVIDAGHGGVDPGAVGVSGTYEKDLTLTYALALRDALKKTGRYRVVMTREDDRFIPLRSRVAMAEQAGGDLFISLHANTHPSQRVRGASIYTLSEQASDAEAAALAAKENRADAIGGLDLSNQTEVVSQILIDLAQRESMNLSKTFANLMVKELADRTQLLRNTHRSADFAVLKSPTVPSVLVEIGYMSHPDEERQLLSESHRRSITEGLVRGIQRHFEIQQALHH